MENNDAVFVNKSFQNKKNIIYSLDEIDVFMGFHSTSDSPMKLIYQRPTKSTDFNIYWHRIKHLIISVNKTNHEDPREENEKKNKNKKNALVAQPPIPAT